VRVLVMAEFVKCAVINPPLWFGEGDTRLTGLQKTLGNCLWIWLRLLFWTIETVSPKGSATVRELFWSFVVLSILAALVGEERVFDGMRSHWLPTSSD
jgi:hypothetical protein